MIKGTVTINASRCKGCQLCIATCPQKVLVLSDAYNASGYPTITLVENGSHCTGCALCALVCPDLVFTVYREASRPKGTRPTEPRRPHSATA